MVAKDLEFGVNARAKILAGVEKLANAVAVTLGPRGRHVVIAKKYGGPHVTKDGVSVAKEISLKDPYEDIGAQLIRQVASKTADLAGDGTTTATVLARAIAVEGSKVVAAGLNPMDIKRGMELAVAEVIKDLKKRSRPVHDNAEIAQVGTISANGDRLIGEKIAEAMSYVGKEGVITVEEAKGVEFEVQIVEGLQFDRGYLSPYFMTNPEKGTVDFENPFILMYDKKIHSMKDLVNICNSIAQASRALVIIADDFDNEVISTLVLNKIQNNLKFVAVKSPGYGDTKKELLTDIAILTNGSVVSEDFGTRLENVTVEMLGQAKRVIINRETTTIVGGSGSKENIEQRVAEIRQLISITKSPYDQEKMQERIAKLTGGIAVLKVGGTTEVEVKERKDRVDDALHATRAAVEEGIVPGGGSALLFSVKVLKDLKAKNTDQQAGIDIIKKALEAPIRQIATNAGIDSSEVVYNVSRHKNTNYGFDAQNLEYGDMMKLGIIDPTKVVRTALEDAVSVSSLLITTEAVIVDSPIEEKDKVPNQGGGMY